jgi:nucleoside-diphosphate-sugar epimerase
MKILVTGATGFLGIHLVTLLLEKGAAFYLKYDFLRKTLENFINLLSSGGFL